jgi:hypothetical protein
MVQAGCDIMAKTKYHPACDILIYYNDSRGLIRERQKHRLPASIINIIVLRAGLAFSSVGETAIATF